MCSKMLPPWIAVAEIKTRRIVYLGQNEDVASARLNPGHCYGRGWILEEAKLEVMKLVNFHLQTEAYKQIA